MKWLSSACSEKGWEQLANNDAYLARPEQGVWVVADGFGDQNHGQSASQLLVDDFYSLNNPENLNDYMALLEHRVLRMNQQLRIEVALQDGEELFVSTFVALLSIGDHCGCLWLGDSRLYRYAHGYLQQMTRDHTYSQGLIEQGIAAQEGVEPRPLVEVITRAVGAQEELMLDRECFTAQPDDVLLLCSDGLYKTLDESDIIQVMEYSKPEYMAQELVDLAIERGARDNVTAVLAVAN